MHNKFLKICTKVHYFEEMIKNVKQVEKQNYDEHMLQPLSQ